VTRSKRLLLAAMLVCACAGAHAHSPVEGVGHFYGGMLHPVLVPAHLIALIAMGLWLAQQGKASNNALVALVLAVPVGMLMGAITRWQQAEMAILAIAATVAVLAGASRALTTRWRALAAGLLGGLLGMDSLPDGLGDAALWLSLGGTWLAVMLLLAGVVVLVDQAVRPWMRLGARVVASWLAAASILVLTLQGLGPGAALPATAGANPPSAVAR
jgi:hydrogenase/urease accessory protein HupE